MGLFHKECYKNAQCAHMGKCVSSLAVPSVLKSRLDRFTEGERELTERKKAPRLRRTVFVRRPGGRLLELEDESRRRPLIYCTVHCCRRWIAPLSSIFSVFLSSMPGSEWCIRVRRGWVLGGSEQPAPTHRGWDTWGQKRIWGKKGSDEERMSKHTRAEHCIQNCIVSGAHVFLANLYLDENNTGVWDIYQTHALNGWSLTVKTFNLSPREL